MIKFKTVLIIISITFIVKSVYSEEKIQKNELQQLRTTIAEAKERIHNAPTYRWNDSLRFLPTVSVSRRGAYDDYANPNNETYISASISFNQLYGMTELSSERAADKRLAIRRIESLGYSIEKLIERRALITRQIDQLMKISRSLEDPLEAARTEERAETLKVRLNEMEIELERHYAEIEYVCVEVEG